MKSIKITEIARIQELADRGDAASQAWLGRVY